MTDVSARELPPDKERVHRRAVRMEWITIAYLLSAIFFLYLTLGSSQAMKAAWLEDTLSLIPPLSFLVAARIRRKPSNRRFQYGYHRAVSIAFLCASLALLTMGLLLLLDSVMKLIHAEHPLIGSVAPFGEPIWLGWLMLPALLWSAVPAAVLGRKKLPLARALHDKVLYADAYMNKADWLTATAAMLGVIGIGVGWWWADAMAASVIAADIAHDGVRNLRTVISDLMDSAPMTIDGDRDPLPTRVDNEVRALPWVRDAQVRLREEGHVYFGELYIVPRGNVSATGKTQELEELMAHLDWRLHDVSVVFRRELPTREG